MTIGYPKARPHLLTQREKAAQVDAQDRRERAICRERREGFCEVIEMMSGGDEKTGFWKTGVLCPRRASQNHHLIGGSGRRNKNRSILAVHRLACCDRCHTNISGHVLQPIGTIEEREAAATVKYVRVR